MGVFGLVPARGGSKGIPGKNIAACGGRPLIGWTCEAATKSARLERTILSTDSDEIARVAREWGIEAPFMRPSELAQDATPSIHVMQHALDWLEKSGADVTALALLQPTSPLRTGAHIDAAVELFAESGADTVVSVVKVPHNFHPSSVMLDDGGWLKPFEGERHAIKRRQDLAPVLARNGPAVLIVSTALVRSGRLYEDRTRAYLMSAEESVDVDDASDLRYADFLLRSRKQT
jgi:CMP-N,N'-diacetyllegionaminic acid synthase